MDYELTGLQQELQGAPLTFEARISKQLQRLVDVVIRHEERLTILGNTVVVNTDVPTSKDIIDLRTELEWLRTDVAVLKARADACDWCGDGGLGSKS